MAQATGHKMRWGNKICYPMNRRLAKLNYNQSLQYEIWDDIGNFDFVRVYPTWIKSPRTRETIQRKIIKKGATK
jgi:hypothetical protein